MSYVVLRDDNEDSLSKTVTSYMGDGWHPIGGVAVVFCDYAERGINEGEAICVWAQAMVRIEKTAEAPYDTALAKAQALILSNEEYAGEIIQEGRAGRR